jgi:hypothetical protein
MVDALLKCMICGRLVGLLGTKKGAHEPSYRPEQQPSDDSSGARSYRGLASVGGRVVRTAY